MSFTKNDRNFRSESGKTFPSGSNTDEISPFEALISQALQREFGLTPASVKAVAKLADANERAVRNWFEGRNGPNGEHLVSLMRHSPAVLATVLNLAGRQDLTVGLIVSEARQRVCNALAALDAVADADRDGQHKKSP